MFLRRHRNCKPSATRSNQGSRRRLLEALEKRVLLAGDMGTNPLHNYSMPADVDQSGHVSALDALTVINELNRVVGQASGEQATTTSDSTEMLYDVSNDGSVTARDALIVVNTMNSFVPALAASSSAAGETLGPSTDLAEGNAGNWSSFPGPGVNTTVSDSTEHVTAGIGSIRFVTDSGSDTGVVFPASADADWDLSTYETFSFELFADNPSPTGFQGEQPIVVLHTQGGTIRYEPESLLVPRSGAASISIPLAGDASWTRTETGVPDLTSVNQFEIIHNTWDAGFTLWYDDVKFLGPPGGLVITQSDGDTVVSETGSSDSFEVKLDQQPTANVVIDLFVEDPTEVGVDVTELTFTPANWDTPQVVSVTGVNDEDRDGDVSSLIQVSISDASAPEFRDLPDGNLGVLTTDGSAGEVRLVDVSFVNGNGAIIAAPTVGEEIGILIEWETEGLENDAQYEIAVFVDGVENEFRRTNGRGSTGPNQYNQTRVGFHAYSGTHAIQVVIDNDNQIAENDEDDNILNISYTSAPIDLPQKFIFPLGGQPGVDWAIGSYMDVLPASDQADYQGGRFQYQDHQGIDSNVPTFTRIDEGIPVLAAAAGIVTEAEDGRFDRWINSDTNSNWITIDHGEGWVSRYFHVAEDSLTVEVGDLVSRGQIIAMKGSSDTSGPHLHFDVKHFGRQIETMIAPHVYYVDPLPYQGDTDPGVLDVLVTDDNPDVSNDVRERMSVRSQFSVGETAEVYAWYRFSHLNDGDTLRTIWTQPDGNVAQVDTIEETTDSLGGWHSHSLAQSRWKNEVGIWSVEIEVNGKSVRSTSFEVSAIANGPEIRIRDASDGRLTPSGRTTAYRFGEVGQHATSPTRSFTIENHGNADLILSGIELPIGFSLVGSLPGTIPPGQSDSFMVELNTETPGTKLGDLLLLSNDSDESTFRFPLEGTITGPLTDGQPSLVRNSSAGTGHVLGDHPALVFSDALLSDAGSSTWDSAVLSASAVVGMQSGDQLTVHSIGDGPGQVSVNGTDVSYGGTHVASLIGSVPNRLVITFNANADFGAAQAVAKRIAWTTSNAESTAPRTVSLHFVDADNNASGAIYREIVVASPRLILEADAFVPGSYVIENGNAVEGVVTRTGNLDQPLTVMLTSEDLSEVTVPASFTIAPGESQGVFTITPTDDPEVDGTQAVLISATSSIGVASDLVHVNDDDSVELLRVTTTADSGAGSLRQAILDANAALRPTTIHFAIAETDAGFIDIDESSSLNGADPEPDIFRIAPLSELPAIANLAGYPITLDAHSQSEVTGDSNPNGTLIEIDGSGAGTAASGLRLAGQNLFVQGLAINQFSRHGIIVAADNVVLQDLFVGVDATGQIAAGNGGDGLLVTDSSHVTLNQNEFALVFSGNEEAGIRVVGASQYVLIEDAVVGTNASGTLGLGNGTEGIFVEGSGDLTISSSLISANGADGISLVETTGPIDIYTSQIGVSSDEALGLGNLDAGIHAYRVAELTIGGTTADSANVIADNGEDGIRLSSTVNVQIEHNFIGTNRAGDSGIGNHNDGIEPTRSLNVVIANNVIASNDRGVSPSRVGYESSLMQWQTGDGGNDHYYVFADLQVPFAVANQIAADAGGYLVSLNSAAEDTFVFDQFGGSSPWIGFNDESTEGEFVWTSGEPVTFTNWRGSEPNNFQNEDAAFMWFSGGWNDADVSEWRQFVLEFESEPDSQILRDAFGRLEIYDNFVGTDEQGKVGLGNQREGLSIFRTSGVDIAGNVISANGLDGVRLSHVSYRDAVITNNLIGTDPTGIAPLGNAGSGIEVGMPNVVIGGRTGEQANVIAFNGSNGVEVQGDAWFGVSIAGNSIHSNVDLGIDLGIDGVSDNDSDTGTLLKENFPILNEVTFGGNSVSITGTLESVASRDYVIDFYADPVTIATDAEGRTYLGSTTVSTDSTGQAAFSVDLDSTLSPDAFVTATATDSLHSTSEFSEAMAVALIPYTVINTNDAGPGSLRQAILDANAATEDVVIQFDVATADPGFVDIDAVLTGGDSGPDVFRIRPLSPLPDLNNAAGHTITIAGATQNDLTGDTNPFGPEIWIDGSQAPPTHGLVFVSDGVSAQGVALGGFGFHGVVIRGNDATLIESYIGTEPTGTAAQSNGGDGVYVDGGNRARIGMAGSGNLISGNSSNGLVVGAGADGTTIQGNRIGTDQTGTVAIANARTGVFVGLHNDATNATIGGMLIAERNIISGNGQFGVFAGSGVVGLNVLNNYIGTNADGDAAIPNQAFGMRLEGGASDITIGAPGAGNVVSGNKATGIADGWVENITIQSNIVGLDASGSVAIPNEGHGISFFDARGITIGGDDPSERNVVSGNRDSANNGAGISVSGHDIVIQGNYVGTNADGDEAFGNVAEGVAVYQSENVTIGGVTAAAGNLVAGNGRSGISVADTHNVGVESNIIGTNIDQSSVMPNANNGIFFSRLVDGAVRNNTAAGNEWAQVSIDKSRSVIVEDNRLGVAGENEISFTESDQGIRIGASNDVIARNNIVAGNRLSGIDVQFSGVAPEAIQWSTDDGGNGHWYLVTPDFNRWKTHQAQAENIGANLVTINDLAENAFLTNLLNNTPGISGAWIGLNDFETEGTYTWDSAESPTYENWRDGQPTGNDNENGVVLWENGEWYDEPNRFVYPGLIEFTQQPDAAAIAAMYGGITITGNMVGVGSDGETPIGNENGVLVVASENVTVGGDNADDANLISGNDVTGIVFANSGNSAAINNRIGVDQDGDGAVANGRDGIEVFDGVSIRITDNVVSGNEAHGVRVRDSESITIDNNLVGLASDAAAPVGNQGRGIDLFQTQDTSVRDNVISDNGQSGLFINRDGLTGTLTQWTIADGGNDHWYWMTPHRKSWLGQDELARSLSADLVTINDAAENEFLRTEFMATAPNGFAWTGLNDIATEANFQWVSGETLAYTNWREGQPNGATVEDFGHLYSDGTWGDSHPTDNMVAIIEFTSRPDAGTLESALGQTVVSGNLIGVAGDGVTERGNNATGVQLFDSQRISLDGNTVAHSSGPGVAASGSSGLAFTGNHIGTTRDGSTGAANSNHGLELFNAHHVSIGGVTPGDGNLISGNGGSGVLVFQGSSNVDILGNTIGINLAGDGELPNAGAGIRVDNASDVMIGNGTQNGANAIAFNLGDGVAIHGNAQQVTVSGNSIYANADLGIDLNADGVTPNDVGDTDAGANGLLNTVRFEVVSGGGPDELVGSLETTADQSFTVEVFLNEVADAGDAEGQTLWYSTSVTTNAAGEGSFIVPRRPPGAVGFVTATVTDASGNTSEFSPPVAPLIDGPALEVTADGQSLSGETLSLGATAPGMVRTRVITVSNSGTQNLILQPIVAPDGFSILDNFTVDQSLAPGSTTTITLQFDADEEGTSIEPLSITSNVDPVIFSVGGTAIETLRLVKDLHPGLADATPNSMIEYDGGVFFLADDGVHGEELWRTDGTPDGTNLVKDINPGSAGAAIGGIYVVGEILVFSASAEATGTNMWRSDGTADGTQVVKDMGENGFAFLLPGSNPNARESGLTSVFFAGDDDTGAGFELWKTDGTEAGTVLVKDINPGEESSFPVSFHSVNGVTYFTANDGVSGDELWRTDGTEAGTSRVVDLIPGGGTGATSPDLFGLRMATVNGELVTTLTDGTTGNELWATDGSEAGTRLIADIRPGSESSLPLFMDSVGDELLFFANDGLIGNELWATDGTTAGTRLVKDVHPGSQSGLFSVVSAHAGDEAYFFADGGSDGREVWVTDATSDGTRQLFDLNPGSAGSVTEIRGMMVSRGQLFFGGNDGTTGEELWVYDLGLSTDTFAPTATVNTLPATSSAKQFVVSVTASDPIDSTSPETAPSGVAEIDIYVAQDGGAFSLWTTVPANNPQATFDADEGHSYAFHALARDLAGNVEAIPDAGVRIEAGTFVPDVTAPTTALVSFDDSGDLLVVNVSANDSGGSGLRSVRVVAQVDDLPEVEIGSLSAASESDSTSGTFSMPIIADSQDHSYLVRVFATDHAGNDTQVGDNGFGFIVINRDPPASLDILAVDIAGGLTQRSYIRDLDLIFNDTQGLSGIASSGLSLVHLGTDGTSPEQSVDLSGKVNVNGSQLQIDFGSQGVGGDADRDTGDGIYELRVDLDGDDLVDEVFRFFRLYGDANGDGVVDNTDRDEVNDAYRNNRSDLNYDLDGNGRVDGRDRRAVSRQHGDEITGF